MSPAYPHRLSLASIDTNGRPRGNSGTATDTSSSAYETAKSSLHSRQQSSEADATDLSTRRRRWPARTRTQSSGSASFHDASSTAQRELDALVSSKGHLQYYTTAAASSRSSSSNSRPASSIDSPHELDHSSGSPFFVPPPQLPSSRTITAHAYDKENVAQSPRLDEQSRPRLRSRPHAVLAAPVALSSPVRAPAKDPNRPFLAKQPSVAPSSLVSTARDRVSSLTQPPYSHPYGFPYSASMIAASATIAEQQLRGPAVRTSRGNKRKTTGSGKEGSVESHRSSSDVDLDLSFEMPPRVEEEGHGADWVGIEMGRDTTKEAQRPQSAMDIRAAYLAGEKAAAAATAQAQAAAAAGIEPVSTAQPVPANVFAISMDSVAAPSTPSAPKRTSWIRKPSVDRGGILPLIGSPPSRLSSRRHAPPPLQPTYQRLSAKKGYAWNPTDPISVPLPESPMSPARQPSFHERSASEAPRGLLPLKLIERTRKSSLGGPSSPPTTGSSATTTWSGSMSTFFVPARERQNRRMEWSPATAYGDGREEDLVAVSPRTGYLNRRALDKGKGVDRRTPSEIASSVFASPLFESEDGDEEESSRTAPTTPNDTPLFTRDQRYEQDDEDEPVQATLSRSMKERQGRLHGLGVDMTGGGDLAAAPSDRRRRSLRGHPPPVLRPTHATIPSLSISPPDEEDELDRASTISDDSALDSTVSPSRRLSNRLSGSYRGGSISYTRLGQPYVDPTPDSSARRLFGSPTPAPPVPGSPVDEARRFSFTPAPLQLVINQLSRAKGMLSGSSSTVVTVTSEPAPAPRQAPVTRIQVSPSPTSDSYQYRRTPMTVLWDLATVPGAVLEETVPAKLAFIAGFLFGPWCWILGGWWLRHADGEMRGQRGRRCRVEGCNCGAIVQLFGGGRRHRAAMAGQYGVGAGGRGVYGDVAEWAGLDPWVFWNRVAAIGSGSVVAALVGVAVWAAV